MFHQTGGVGRHSEWCSAQCSRCRWYHLEPCPSSGSSRQFRASCRGIWEVCETMSLLKLCTALLSLRHQWPSFRCAAATEDRARCCLLDVFDSPPSPVSLTSSASPLAVCDDRDAAELRSGVLCSLDFLLGQLTGST